MSTQEQNKLIAEFMGYEVINYKGFLTYDGNRNAKTVGEFQKMWGGLDLQLTGRKVSDIKKTFCSDWNHIMPVVTKIISMKNVYPQKRQKVYKSINPDIGITHQAVVEFITWYNENNKS